MTSNTKLLVGFCVLFFIIVLMVLAVFVLDHDIRVLAAAWDRGHLTGDIRPLQWLKWTVMALGFFLCLLVVMILLRLIRKPLPGPGESVKDPMNIAIKDRLSQAVEQGELSLLYQPIFELRSKRVVGVEALLRWYDPDRGLLTPPHFLPTANDSLLQLIDLWVVRQACVQYQQWLSDGIAPQNLSINLATIQDDYPALIIGIMNSLKIPKNRVYLELTEQNLLRHEGETDAVLQQLVAQGVRLAIDDFGKAYSSLSRLHELPISLLKIDASFVSSIGTEKESEIMIKSIIDLAKALKLTVVAEGIETGEQLHCLLKLGCHYGQGYYYSDPLEPEDIVRHLK